MSKLKIIAVAAALSALTATPVFAQAAIQEPGLFAFYYPNLDVLNGGAPTPAYQLEAEHRAPFAGNLANTAQISARTRHANH